MSRSNSPSSSRGDLAVIFSEEEAKGYEICEEDEIYGFVVALEEVDLFLNFHEDFSDSLERSIVINKMKKVFFFFLKTKMKKVLDPNPL